MTYTIPQIPTTAASIGTTDLLEIAVAGGNSAQVAWSSILGTAQTWTAAQTFVGPVLGAATATSINKVAITAPATGATLTIADGKTLNVTNNATVSGTNTGDSGTVTSIVAGAGLTGGTISSSGTIALDLTSGNTWTAAQTVKVTDAATATVTNCLIISHDSSGTAAASFGTGIKFQGQDSTTADQDLATIQAVWTVATQASRASALLFQTITAAGSLTTNLTLNGTGQLLAVNGTVSLPSYSFVNDATTGLFYSASVGFEFSYAGVLYMALNNAGLNMRNSIGINWGTGVPNATVDCGLIRTVAGVIKVSDGSSGQGWLQNSAARARNTADVPNATNTMANLTDLSRTLIAGRKYTGRLVLFANNSTAAEGLQIDFNGGGATMTSFEAGFAATPPGSGLVLGTLTTTGIATALTVTTATTGDACYTIEFTLVCNAAGTFIPRFAENSAHTSGTATVRLGSNIWIEDMPN